MARGGRLPFAALGFAVAAAFSSWNPLAAPFGILVGLGAIVLGVRALRLGTRRKTSLSAIAVSGLAILVSALVLALTAGVGRDAHGEAVVAPPPAGDVAAELDGAGERTRAARERARAEMEGLGAGKSAQPGERPSREQRSP